MCGFLCMKRAYDAWFLHPVKRLCHLLLIPAKKQQGDVFVMSMTSTQSLRRMTFWIALVCLMALSTVLSACGGDATTPSTSSSGSAPSTTQSNAATVATTITIREKTGGHDIYSFDPPSVTIKAGQAVLFDNQSDEFHLLMTADASGNPTADATPFTATTIVPTSRASSTTTLQVVFTTPGTYHYTSKLVKRLTDGQHPEGAMSQGSGTVVVN